MRLNAYLERIGFAGDARPDLATLRALHRAHLLAIPYENLEVQLARPVTIERPAIYEKIVGRRRGGWCYEMNGMLGWALKEIGFRVARGAGAVMREMGGDATIGNHLVLPVMLDEGLYLADVGFGDGPLEPIRIVPGDFAANGFRFGLSEVGGGWWRLRNHPHGGAPSFDFTLGPADENHLAAKCHDLQTNPESFFVQNLFCFRHTLQGFTSLRGRVLRHVTPAGVADERLVADGDDLVGVLRDEFGLDVPEAAALWQKIAARHEVVMAEATRSTG